MPGVRSTCAIAHVLDMVGDHWTLFVIRDIILGKTSFSEISALHDPDTAVPPPMRERLENDFEGVVDSLRSQSKA